MLAKRGQVALLVIVAVVIIALILLLVLFPSIRPTHPSVAFTPQAFLASCITPELSVAREPLLKRGGYADPQGYLAYQGEKIKYLCYTAEFYKTCVVQEPFIKEQVEQELARALKPAAQSCITQLTQEYERQGYTVAVAPADVQVLFSPHALVISFLAPMTVTKESSQTFKEFNVRRDSELYDIFLTATSIVAFESAYGDSETTLYMQYYPDITIEKTKLSDGSKVYKVSNVVTQEQFTFASRSLAWPPGYGGAQ